MYSVLILIYIITFVDFKEKRSSQRRKFIPPLTTKNNHIINSAIKTRVDDIAYLLE